MMHWPGAVDFNCYEEKGKERKRKKGGGGKRSIREKRAMDQGQFILRYELDALKGNRGRKKKDTWNFA